MKHYLILMLFLLFGITASAQQKKVNVDIKGTSYTEKLNYANSDIDNLTLHESEEYGVEKKTIFQKPVNFAGANFLHFADWRYAVFLDTTVFDQATFKDTAYFRQATFSKFTTFSQTKFLRQAYFNTATFSGLTDFSGSEFSGEASFDGAIFLKYTAFIMSDFSHGAHFNYAKFADWGIFSAAVFKARSSLSLMNITLRDSSNLDFDDTVLPDTIYFSDNGKIKNEIDFSRANFTDTNRYDYKLKQPKPIWIYLYNSDIAKLHLDYVHYKLLLPDSTVIIPDPNSNEHRRFISPDEKSSMYEALLNNFKTKGQTESYKLLDVEYQQFKWNHSWTHQIPCIPKYWWNFGYDKEYIFGWTLLLLLVFTCFSFIYIHSLNTKVYTMERIQTNPAWEKKLSLKDFGNRLWYSFMYTSTVFFMLSLKIENLHFKEKRGTFYLVTVYSIGLICIAYVANFILQK